jgi:flagellar motor component MotA
MFLIIGIVVVFGAVVAGYLMEHGNIRVLLQPAELVIIRGAAIGTVLIANQLYILKAIVAGIAGAFGGSKFKETLKMMYELFGRARKEGLMALETDSDAPDKSPVFSKYPKFLKDYHALPFVCDTIRMAAGGGVKPFDVDQMMELDMDVHHHDAAQPISALSTMADSLPGLGIVAALLIGENQVMQVRGFADQRLRKKDDPLDPSNRRISLIVQYTERKPVELPTGGEGGAKPQDDTTKPASNPGENSAPASHNKK